MPELVDAVAIKDNLTACNTAWRLKQTDNGSTREGLSGPGFPHHAQHFTSGNINGDLVNRT